MKKYLFILLFLTIIFGCQKRESANVNIREFDNSLNESNSDSKIDISKMEKIVNEAGSMNLDVFFAISVLHKNFISQFLNEVQDLSEEKQKDFFLNKKNEFFKKLKFSEEEYNSFMEKNAGLMNDYINRHPEIAEYLTTIN